MADPHAPGFAEHAGTVLFPRNTADLTSTTQCPACFTPLSGRVCSRCRLDLGSPLAAELATTSADAAALLTRRLELIGHIRYDSARRTVAAPVAPAPVRVPEPVAPSSAPPAPVVPLQPATPAAPRRSSVQVILLIVGVSLLSVAAIFFLVYAFITYGIVWRSIIIASITIAAFAAASILRRRKLTATAEGIAVFAIVLVYLDAFAVRANDLFGSGRSDPLVYWGATVLASAVVFYGWHRLSSLRVASVAAFAALTPGAFLLVAGLGTDDGLFAAFAAAATIGLVHPLSAKLVERTILLSLASFGWLLAFGFAFAVSPGSQWAPAFALAALAIIAVPHVVVTARHPGLVAWARGFAGAAGVAAAVAVGAGALRGSDLTLLVVIPAVAAVVVAASLDLLKLPLARIATACSGAVAALLLLPAALFALALPARAIAAIPWSLAPGDALPVADDATRYSLLALAISVALVAASSFLSRTSRRIPLASATAAVLVLAVPLLEVQVTVAAGWFLVAALALGVLVLRRATRLTVPLAVTAPVAAALGFAASWSSETTWLPASLALIALLLVSRRVAPAPAMLGIAVGVGFLAASALAIQLSPVRDVATVVDLLHFVGILAVALLGLSVIRRLKDGDRGVLFWLAFPTIAVAGAISHLVLVIVEPASLLLPGFGTGVVVGVAAAGILAVVSQGSRVTEGIVASAALGPAAYWVIDSFARMLGVQTVVVPLAAAIIVAATGFVGRRRLARDIGVGIVVLPALLSATIVQPELPWLALVLAAVATLLVATSRDGLIGSSSRRRQLGWLALALATGGLWWRLRTDDITTVEAYVLPVSGALLLIALLLWRAKRGGVSSVLLAGLLVAIAPIALVAASGAIERAVIVGVVSAALLLGGSLVPNRPYGDALAVAGVVGVITLMIGRAFTSDAIDVWLGAGLVVLAVAAVGQSRKSEPLRASVMVVAGLVIATAFELPALADDRLGTPRALVLVILLSAVYLVDRPPLTRTVGWIALGLGGITATVGVAVGALDPLETATLPLAIALLAAGSVQLARSTTAGSWPHLAPGLLVLLLPSLIATIGDRPLWRLVAIGVVAIAVIIVGVTRRLQAPFIIGTVVVLIHAIATFAPQIRDAYLSLPWWLWAGIGGLVITVLAARIEHRIRNLKSAVSTISALR